jgi:hypothetical protein
MINDFGWRLTFWGPRLKILGGRPMSKKKSAPLVAAKGAARPTLAVGGAQDTPKSNFSRQFCQSLFFPAPAVGVTERRAA